MNIMITDEFKTETARGATYTVGNTCAFVSIRYDGVVNVCKKNAAHRVWKGCGKFFSSAGEALAGYKSPEMRTIIRVACNLDG